MVRAVWVAVSGLLALSSCTSEPETLEFDRARWVAAAGQDEYDNARCQMVDDARTLVTTGMTRENVERLLGDPDVADDVHLDYWLGGCDALSIDVHSLWIRLESGRVIATDIRVG